jgi:hypothetical protein
MNITADHVARAIVAAAREFDGVHPEKVIRAPTERSLRDDWAPIGLKRARAYAALALFEVFPDWPQASIARMVGSLSPKTYIWSCEHLKRTGKYDSWWNAEAFARVIAAIAPRPVPAVPPQTAPQAKPVTPKAVLRKPAGKLRTRLDAIAGGVSLAPRSPSNSGVDWLTERAIDRGRSRDLLAEAAANTKKLQDAMPKDEGGE